MAATDRGILFKQINRLFNEGTLSAVGEAQLLDRYLSHRDELAFEALVERHGPMVLSLCRRMLRDPRDIEDAFQATFLILVRKAPSIRDRQQLSSWLYGVAYKVATRARRAAIRRRNRESTPDPAAREPSAPFSTSPEHLDLDLAPVLDQELARLPEKYRQPLILVYLDGISHEQAAQLMRCAVGTVRSRMARGRALLKTRLARRGLAPMSIWLGNGLTNSLPIITESVPAPLVVATVKAATHLASTKLLQSTAIAASVLSLTKGVLTTMQIAQYKWAAIGLLASTVSAGGVVAVGYASGPGSTHNPHPSSLAVPLTTIVKSATAETKIPSPPTDNPPVAEHKMFEPPLTELSAIANRNDRIEALAARLNQALDQYSQISATVERQGPETTARKEVQMAYGLLREMARNLRLRLDSFDEDVRRTMLELTSARARKEKTSARLERMATKPDLAPSGADAEEFREASKEDAEATSAVMNKIKKLEDIYENRNSDRYALKEIERHLASLQKRVDRARNFGGPPLLAADPPQHLSPPAPAIAAAEPQPATAPPTSKPSLPLDERQRPIAPPGISEFLQNHRQRPAAEISNLDIQMLILPLKQKLEEFDEATRKFATNPEVAAGMRRDHLRNEITQHATLLTALRHDLENELEQLKQEQVSARAEVDLATAKRHTSELAIARNKRLNERKPGMVSAEDVAKAESELTAESANLEIAKSNAKKPAIRARQLETKIASITAILASAANSLNQAPRVQPAH